MDPEESSYYPPRARRWLPLQAGQAVDRALLGSRRLLLRSPWGFRFFLTISGKHLLLGALIPGYGYALFGQKRMGQIFLAAWCLCAAVMVVFIKNEWVTGWAVGGMASSHSSGLSFLALRHVESDLGYQPPLRYRIIVPLVLWAVYAMLVYWPAYDLFRRNVVLPLRITTNDRSVLINPRIYAAQVRRGDLIAFNGPGFTLIRRGQVPVIAKEGPLTGRVLGVPGDRIEFTAKAVLVNGKAVERSELMPVVGSFVVEPNHWWVWPDVFAQINNGMNLDASSVSEAFANISRVPQSDFLGRAYGRWFFFRQETR